MNDFTVEFNHYFEVLPATTPELLEDVFRLRYRVYCEELHLADFEPERYPQGLERDDYDERSVHYLLRHRARNEDVGTVRLILPDSNFPQTRFPLEEHAERVFRRDVCELVHLPRARTAEISRLILTNALRSRPGEGQSPYGTADNIPSAMVQARRHFPHPVLGLFVAIMRMSVEHEITHWYAGMEPVLNRLLRRFGLHLKAIGPVVEYHGKRQPFLGVVDDVMNQAYTKHPEAWSLLTDEGRLWPPPRHAA